LRRDFVLTDESVGQLAIDLEFNWDEVVAAKLPGAAICHERLDGVEVFLAAERRSSSRQHLCRIGCLAKGEQRAGAERYRHQPHVPQDTHPLSPR
jgi:hypothetical protein